MADEKYVDWELASRTARRLLPDGPKVSLGEAHATVEDLRDAARRAHDPVATTAQLDTSGRPDSPVHVVDRAHWIDVNVASMSALLDPVVDKMTAKRKAGAAARAVSAKVSGAEAGAVMGWVSTKVLGQYDLAPDGQPSLLLVAPNIVAAERQLKVDPADFRLWVCLHEETHRVQFTAVPWLREHLVQRVRTLMVDLVPEPDELPQRLQEILGRLPEALREGGTGLADLVTTPEQREQLANVTAVMSLLEGHADVVMDDVGPQIVPTVEEIRRRFDKRRQGAGAVDRLLRRLLGMEAKMRQYRDGAKFCRTVQDRVGVEGFNAVWTSPQTLPTAREIEAPLAWIERVHG
ncbi:zinc-dependent metalloprotease [Calidifontibacter sp. DB0510]|uniref:Zinc-dependent metalloprotease n=1 Tax=Metallococcus carri TaxID=1656884 RepID=A0A967B0W9_9MICO|nr:zinc-dependent metalloprotease [Metallococcus carri]NHN55370.1 zinc-dependent metalloprotease [Metallococcus carri]NOP36447.1 zinc-dependent metalloprotease [Calidifontibacter sp. DB2511S]